MPSKSKRLTRSELSAYEAKRDLAADLLQSVRQMKAGKVQVVTSPVIEARRKTGLSQSQFAALLGVSVRTLQGWEQGRKQPSGAAAHVASHCDSEPEGSRCRRRHVALAVAHAHPSFERPPQHAPHAEGQIQEAMLCEPMSLTPEAVTVQHIPECVPLDIRHEA